MKHILIIDDDIYIGDMLQELLEKNGYSVGRAYSGTEALYACKARTPDLALLDLMLPGLSGEDVLSEILLQFQSFPVIVVSAKISTDDKVNLLLSGASDYVTKPFDTKELLARIAVQLRAPAFPAKLETLTFKNISLHTASFTVTVGSDSVRLTRTEFALLKLLMEHPSQVMTKAILLEGISQDTPDCVESSLKVHISNLRKKLKDAGGKDYIESVWGIGFKMNENA
ncbi:response regulator transcription factor [Ihubacter sp. rT4E-8]|uniref:response regulator transcription factor n=1 Tax=unclassified Ihubacter TaxID=2633299 RepID=UPI00137A070B